MSGHIKWNRVGRFGISSMLLLIIMGCGHNMRIENPVEQNTVEIQKVEDHAGTIVLPEGQFYEIIKNNPIEQRLFGKGKDKQAEIQYSCGFVAGWLPKS